MSSFFTSALAAGPPAKKLPCSVGTFLAALPAGERPALEAMLADRQWSTAAIHKLMAASGFDRLPHRVWAHRSGQCSCKK